MRCSKSADELGGHVVLESYPGARVDVAQRRRHVEASTPTGGGNAVVGEDAHPARILRIAPCRRQARTLRRPHTLSTRVQHEAWERMRRLWRNPRAPPDGGTDLGEEEDVTSPFAVMATGCLSMGPSQPKVDGRAVPVRSTHQAAAA